MPSVIDAPEIVEHEEHALYEAHDLYKEQLPVREAHPEFWHRVLQYVKRHRVQTPHGTPSSSHGLLHHPIETPADLLARQSPSLYIRAYAGV
jgi:hypothetical protein